MTKISINNYLERTIARAKFKKKKCVSMATVHEECRLEGVIGAIMDVQKRIKQGVFKDVILEEE